MTEITSPRVYQQDEVTVIELGEEYENLDEAVLTDLRNLILKAVDQAEPPLVVLDLSHTKFFGSSFIELIFRAWNRLQARDKGKFVLSGLMPYCKEVIEITHLDQLWTLYDSVDEAVVGIKA
jgi:anti-anti-sigma factor